LDLSLSPEDLAFRDEVRRFLADNVRPGMGRAIDLTTAFIVDPDVLIDFHRALHRKGWSVPHWPVEHGGTGWSPVQRYIFDLECGSAGAATYNASGSHFVGPVIIHYGTQQQKDRYLPRIRSGEDYWAQGYSEPGSGSDLASMKTRAVADGDHYVVNGQKIWTTNAHRANRMFALVRTATTGKRQDGITFVLFDMDMPGITVRPIVGNGGDHEFNEVFFNDVRVPIANRIGEENKGWEVAKFLLEFERGGRVLAGQVRAQFAKLVQLMKTRGQDDGDLRTRLAEIGTDLDAMEMMAAIRARSPRCSSCAGARSASRSPNSPWMPSATRRCAGFPSVRFTRHCSFRPRTKRWRPWYRAISIRAPSPSWAGRRRFRPTFSQSPWSDCNLWRSRFRVVLRPFSARARLSLVTA
jgi:acyl-CoA dehydrogenase